VIPANVTLNLSGCSPFLQGQLEQHASAIVANDMDLSFRFDGF